MHHAFASATRADVADARRVAVIGGGITGLAAAYRLIELADQNRSPLAVTLFEASGRLGGIFGSERIGEYLIERGADSFITIKPGAIELCRRLGIEDRLLSTNPHYRRSLILFQAQPAPTPDGFNLVAPTRLRPVLSSPILSWRGKLRILQERFVPPRVDPQDESVSEFVRRRFGTEVLDRIVQPLVGGIYTSDPQRLSLHATLPRFAELERRYGSVLRGLKRETANSSADRSASGARYSLFVAPQAGMQEILNSLESRLTAQVHIRRSTAAKRITKTDVGWTVSSADDSSERFDGILLALPASAAAQLLDSVDPVCAEELRGIESASSAIVVTGHRLADFEHPLDAFGLVIPHREGRRILAVSFLSRKFEGRAPEGKIILRTFVGGAMQPEEYERTDSEMLTTVLAELQSIFGLRADPDFAVVVRYPAGMPQFHVGHLNRVKRIRDRLSSISRLELAGNYFEGVGIPDCIASGEQAAESLLVSLTHKAAEFPHSSTGPGIPFPAAGKDESDA